MHEIRNERIISIKPAKSDLIQSLMLLIILPFNVIYELCYLNKSVLHTLSSTVVLGCVIIPPAIAGCKTIILDADGVIFKLWFYSEKYQWWRIQLWEDRVFNEDTRIGMGTSYKYAMVITPITTKRSKIWDIVLYENFIHPFAFVIIRYAPKTRKKNELILREFDKEKLLTQLDAWGVIKIDEWMKQYPK